jgi:hypothetical protein
MSTNRFCLPISRLLKFLDFVVYTVSDDYVERIYFNEEEWECTLPQLTEFYFEYLMALVTMSDHAVTE